jgi:chromosome segregation ATPase
MAVAEKELFREIQMEDRIARLETHAEHFRKDLVRIEGKLDKLDEKVEVKARELDAKIEKLDQKIEKLDQKIDVKVGELDKKIDAQRELLVEFRIEMVKKLGEIANGRMADRVWLLLIGAALLSVMARGFKWI